jgi:hypothetical protein
MDYNNFFDVPNKGLNFVNLGEEVMLGLILCSMYKARYHTFKTAVSELI